MRNNRVRRLVCVAVLLAAALVLSWLERFIPMPMGLHLGLSNMPLVLVLYGWGFWAALGFGVLKSVLSLLFLGRLSGLLYSLCGIVLAVCAMGLCKRLPCFSLFGVNGAGAMLHGVGQLCAAAVLFQSPAVFAMLPWMSLCGFFASVLTYFPLQTVLNRGFLPPKIE